MARPPDADGVSIPRHSYDLRDLDGESELGRLERQVRRVQALERPFIDRIGLPSNATVVDLGCGPGFMSRVLGEVVPDGRVLGVDLDRGLLGHARAGFQQTTKGARGYFLRAWADRLPLRDRIADLVYTRFLLQHVPDPAAVLAEARRVNQPGGWTIAVDTDDGGLVVHPEPPGFQRLLQASRAAQARVGGDRHVGRKLRGHFVAAGFRDVNVEVTAFTSEQVGLAAFVDITLGFKRQIIPEDLMPATEVEGVLADLAALDAGKGAFAHALGYAAFGRAP